MTSTHSSKQTGAHPATQGAAHAPPHGSPDALTPEERRSIAHDFKQAVNMTPAALRKWLATDDAKRVGYKGEDSESVGHKSGLRIVEILDKTSNALTEEDYRHMRKVVGYVHRHLAQGPTKQDVESSDWRYSLMNWGHDPMKK